MKTDKIFIHNGSTFTITLEDRDSPDNVCSQKYSYCQMLIYLVIMKGDCNDNILNNDNLEDEGKIKSEEYEYQPGNFTEDSFTRTITNTTIFNFSSTNDSLTNDVNTTLDSLRFGTYFPYSISCKIVYNFYEGEEFIEEKNKFYNNIFYYIPDENILINCPFLSAYGGFPFYSSYYPSEEEKKERIEELSNNYLTNDDYLVPIFFIPFSSDYKTTRTTIKRQRKIALKYYNDIPIETEIKEDLWTNNLLIAPAFMNGYNVWSNTFYIPENYKTYKEHTYNDIDPIIIAEIKYRTGLTTSTEILNYYKNFYFSIRFSEGGDYHSTNISLEKYDFVPRTRYAVISFPFDPVLEGDNQTLSQEACVSTNTLEETLIIKIGTTEYTCGPYPMLHKEEYTPQIISHEITLVEKKNDKIYINNKDYSLLYFNFKLYNPLSKRRRITSANINLMKGKYIYKHIFYNTIDDDDGDIHWQEEEVPSIPSTYVPTYVSGRAYDEIDMDVFNHHYFTLLKSFNSPLIDISYSTFQPDFIASNTIDFNNSILEENEEYILRVFDRTLFEYNCIDINNIISVESDFDITPIYTYSERVERIIDFAFNNFSAIEDDWSGVNYYFKLYSYDNYYIDSIINLYESKTTLLNIEKHGIGIGTLSNSTSSNPMIEFGENYTVRFRGKVDIFPVGFIYITVDDTNPSEYFYGTWERFALGRTLVGVDGTDTTNDRFSAPLKLGGASTVTLTSKEMPSHRHQIARFNSADPTETGVANFAYNSASGSNNKRSWTNVLTGYSGGIDATTTSAGTTQAHNNLQPYITCYMWRRIA